MMTSGERLVFGFSSGGACCGYDTLEVYEFGGFFSERYANEVFDGTERTYDMEAEKAERLEQMIEREGIREWRECYEVADGSQDADTEWSIYDGHDYHYGHGAAPANFAAVLDFLGREFGCDRIDAFQVVVEEPFERDGSTRDQPNEESLAAIDETEAMIRDESGQAYRSGHDLIQAALSQEDR